MPRIDSQMLNIYQNSTQGSNEESKKLSKEETIMLIKRAEEINNTSSSSCFNSDSSRKGNKYLLRLVRQNEEGFSSGTREIIQEYLQHGKIPIEHSTRLSEAVPSIGIATRPVNYNVVDNGRINTRPEARAHPSANSSSTPVATRPANYDAVDNGRINTRPEVPAHPSANSSSTPVATRPANYDAVDNGRINTRPEVPAHPSHPGRVNSGTDIVGPRGKEILNFSASKRTWECHWFPMQETRPGGDPVNNLYSEGGPLDKLDKLTGAKAREYEFGHNRKSIEEGNQFSWWGHCDKAASLACLLVSPKNPVIMTNSHGEQIRFTRNDIQGLLVKVASSLSTKVDFKGERFNEASRDDPNEPAPEIFMEVIQEWAKDGLPFVLDIDRSKQVWNFPYDQVIIYESDQSPDGFDPSSISGDASVKYYHIDMAGTGFDSKIRKYECFVQRDSSGHVIKSAWIKTPNTHNNPDFMWRPHPVANLMEKSSWQTRGTPSNPEVDPQVVYEIYMKSLA